MNTLLRFIRNNFELLLWPAALLSLAFTDPTQTHFVLCPLRLMGLTWCPGCGLGHSIAFLLHGQLGESWHAHWLGVPALGILLWRTFTLARLAVKKAAVNRAATFTDNTRPFTDLL